MLCLTVLAITFILSRTSLWLAHVISLPWISTVWQRLSFLCYLFQQESKWTLFRPHWHTSHVFVSCLDSHSPYMITQLITGLLGSLNLLQTATEWSHYDWNSLTHTIKHVDMSHLTLLICLITSTCFEYRLCYASCPKWSKNIQEVPVRRYWYVVLKFGIVPYL